MLFVYNVPDVIDYSREHCRLASRYVTNIQFVIYEELILFEMLDCHNAWILSEHSGINVAYEMILSYTMLSMVLKTVCSFKVIYFHWKSGQFNTSCEVLAVTNKKSIPSFIYHISAVPIKAVQHVEGAY